MWLMGIQSALKASLVTKNTRNEKENQSPYQQLNK